MELTKIGPIFKLAELLKTQIRVVVVVVVAFFDSLGSLLFLSVFLI